MNNPFELTFGLKPNNYISRLKQSEEITQNFNSPTGNRVYLITGVRGTGKTVMLSHISKYYENSKDWIVVELIPNYDMLEQLASYLYDSSILNKILNKKSFGFSFSGISFSISGDKPVTNVISLIEILLQKIKAHKKNVLITIDEVSNNDYVKTFTQAFQVLVRKEFPIHLLMTGLYQNIYELQNNKDLTFLYRAPKINLEPLNLAAITFSYKELLNISQEDAAKLAKKTKGYAYAYQVLGYLVWERKNANIDAELMMKFDQYLQEYVYDKMYSELSSNDKIVLKSFENDGVNNVEDLLKKSKMKKNIFSVYRDRLIKRGIIEAPEYGKLYLKLPRFYEFIINQI
ncbi:MAG: ATP-binding protein [Acholeplasmatales bacterium]|nr:ATP-binding protein [Acholeplasmatales bacterium]